jgi:hypothetical protein
MSASDKRYSVLRRIMLGLGLVLVAAIIYDGAIFYARWNERTQAGEAQARSETDHARKAIESVGGGGLKILNFYAAPAAIRRGEHTTVCYGVTGAKTVRLDPPVAEVWPALSRCLQVSPKQDTEYKLSAEDGAGHSTTGSLQIRIVH